MPWAFKVAAIVTQGVPIPLQCSHQRLHQLPPRPPFHMYPVAKANCEPPVARWQERALCAGLFSIRKSPVTSRLRPGICFRFAVR
jgi:hypothetical protein